MSDRPRRGVRLAAGVVLLAALAMPALCGAADEPRFDFPQLDAPPEERGPGYSYYYVPRLSEINQRLGGLFQSGRVRLGPDPGSEVVARYAAYSCQGTLHLAVTPTPAASVDVDWRVVRTLRRGPGEHGPSILVEHPNSAGAQSLVLYVSDVASRDLLQEALAILVTACRPHAR